MSPAGHDLEITTWAEQPDPAGFAGLDPWPAFMQHDPTGGLYYGRLDRFAEHVLIARSRADGEVVARACAVPFRAAGPQLPDGGWDAVIRAGVETLLPGNEPNVWVRRRTTR